MLKDIASKNKPDKFMYKSTIKTLQILQTKSAQKIAMSEHPEINIAVSRVFFPIYEISAVLMSAAQKAKKAKHRTSVEDRAVLMLVKNKIKDLYSSVQRIHYVPGYPYADRMKEVQEMQADVAALEAIITDLLA